MRPRRINFNSNSKTALIVSIILLGLFILAVLAAHIAIWVWFGVNVWNILTDWNGVMANEPTKHFVFTGISAVLALMSLIMITRSVSNKE